MNRHRDRTVTPSIDGAGDLSYRAFSAARERYFARLRADTEIRRLERIFHTPAMVRDPRQGVDETDARRREAR